MTSPTTSSQSWRSALAVLLAFAALNTLLSMRNWWPTPGVLPDTRLAPELVAIWTLLLALAWRGSPSARLLHWLAAGTLALVLGRYFNVTVPTLFGRPVNLYWDGQQIPTFVWVSLREYPWWLSLAIVVGATAALALLYALIRWALGVLARVAAPYALRARWAWAAGTVAAFTVLAHQTGLAPGITWHLVTDPVTPTYARQAVLLANAFLPGRVERVLPPSTALDAALALPPRAALGALKGRDFKLVFLESYGAMAFDHPRAAPALDASRQRLAHEIERSGHRVASAFVRAPTFAGASDLSHLSLLAGIDLSDPLRHDLLLTTDRPTLTTLFRRAGYQSVGLYPALSWDWFERDFYGFDLFLDARDLDYRGPPLGYWKVPDQFSLARFEQLHPRAAHAPPRFLFFPTITTHLPFGPVPPYQPDWQRLLTPDPFGAEELKRLLASFVDWVDMLPNYIGMFDYTYRWIGGWLQQAEPRESVILLVGDHQPAASVSGAGASWEVPVHLITRDPALLERFVALGFAPGLHPQRPALGGMHDLTGVLLKALADRDVELAGRSAPAMARATR